ncbi:aldehyde dehydrogenase family protein [Streptomyces sp. URMC 127]|uniref:aldehyde dehydrogenase family protein n=1 Tax=Streptomyces sp. URMC 127 TaxID=3423402 RepID=UPI003F1CC770
MAVATGEGTVGGGKDGVVALPLLTHRGMRRTRAQETVYGVDGCPLASLSLSPDLLTSQSILAQGHADPLPAYERTKCLAEAAQRYLDDVIGGLSFEEHCAYVRRVSGHNARVTEQLSRAVAAAVAEAPARADRARPLGSLGSWREAVEGAGSGVWTRRGETLAAVLSGNAPTIQSGWLQALALGYRVAVRPSRREPFTAYRVIEALRAAGFRDTDAVYLPTTHTGVPVLLQRADLALVYGGDDVKARYGASPTVKVGGPGRTKTLVGREYAGASALGSIAESVSALSGAACVNTTAVLVEGDHARFAGELADVLRGRAGERQVTAQHLGPRVSRESAEALMGFLRRSASRARALIPLEDVATPHPDGGVVLGPAVFTVEDPHDSLLAMELPFPCVWVAPWTRDDGIAPLRDSLVVNAMTDDTGLIDELVHEPSITNVYVDVPTVHSDGNLPHEGYLGDFLMRNKAVVSSGARRPGTHAPAS